MESSPKRLKVEQNDTAVAVPASSPTPSTSTSTLTLQLKLDSSANTQSSSQAQELANAASFFVQRFSKSLNLGKEAADDKGEIETGHHIDHDEESKYQPGDSGTTPSTPDGVSPDEEKTKQKGKGKEKFTEQKN